jgi:hypothetical protein
MPIVVIAAAAATFVEGAALVAAATTIAGTVAAGAMMVGAALTIAGTVTGNDKLTKWGAVIGIAGGFGSLAASAIEGTAATAAADTGGALADASAADITAQTTGIAQGENVGSVLNVAPPAPPQPSGLMPSGAEADQVVAAESLNHGAPSTTDITGSTPASTPTAATSAPSSATAPMSSTSTFNSPAPSTTSAFTPGGTGAFDANASQGVFDSSGNPLYKSPGPENWWDKFKAFAKDNPEIARAGFSGAQGLLTGIAPSPLNRYYGVKAAQTQSETDIARMKAGLAPGWWSKAAPGG